MDDQYVPKTFDTSIPLLRKNKEEHIFVSSAEHGPTEVRFNNAYVEIFFFWIISSQNGFCSTAYIFMA
jgi:hypothetical protein|tara:strand:+ start:319 stop:522 length:204 start_codon:yes stop_codon:yes gene_type:complete